MASPVKLVHTCMRVRDIDASLRFYEALGFERRGKLDATEQLGRNDPCWCGSGKKFKKCHGA